MLKTDIGINAGIIWNLLSVRERMTIRELGELTHFKGYLITLALGWLSREDKIEITDMEGTVHVKLKNEISELYY